MSNGSRVSKRPGAKTTMSSHKMKSIPGGSAKALKSFGKSKAKMGNKKPASRGARNAGSKVGSYGASR